MLQAARPVGAHTKTGESLENCDVHNLSQSMIIIEQINVFPDPAPPVINICIGVVDWPLAM